MISDGKLQNGLRLELGSGADHFTMQRGSFSYRQTSGEWRRARLFQKKRGADQTELWYFDPKSAQKICLVLQNEPNRLTIRWKGCIPDGVNRFRLTFKTGKDEHFYGCGETYAKFDLAGESVRIWVAEHQNSRRISQKMVREKLIGPHPNHTLPFDQYESYYAQPTFVSSAKYFLCADTDAYCAFDFRTKGQVTLLLEQAPQITIGWADSFLQLSENLTALLGRARMLPTWLLGGGILACQKGTESIKRRVDKTRGAGAEIVGVWCQDWCGCRKTKFGYQVMWNWHYDAGLYPALPETIAELRERGIRFLGYINPFLAIEGDVYREAAERGYCVKDKDGKDYLVTITTFPAAMIDLTNPDACAWYKDLIKKNMIGIGMSGWMADFGEYLPVDCVLADGEDPALAHNTWPARWAKLNREAIRESGVQDEVFFFTRAGHTGTLAASDMMWTGDQHVDWSVDDGLPSVIPATLSLAMSGFAITHSDVGGYTTQLSMRRTKELLMRWEEMCAFSPLMRCHEGNQPDNNVQVDDDEELLAQFARCTVWHKRLAGYLADCLRQAAERGTPVMRPLFYHYDEPPLYPLKTEYLLGRDILVAPVLEPGADARLCYLPQDQWVHLFTRREYAGGNYRIQAPVGQPPVFIRKQSDFFEQLISITKNTGGNENG